MQKGWTEFRTFEWNIILVGVYKFIYILSALNRNRPIIPVDRNCGIVKSPFQSVLLRFYAGEQR